MPGAPSSKGFVNESSADRPGSPTSAEIASVLRKRILDRVTDYQTQLPSVAVLQREFGVSPTTVRRAEKILADAQLVIISNGRRARVTPGPVGTLTALEYEITSIIKDLDALRHRIGSLHKILDPYLNYSDEQTELRTDN